MFAYVSIGNSDDKLTQKEWADFVADVDRIFATHYPEVHVHGRWFSAPDVEWQSACWAIEYRAISASASLRSLLRTVTATYRQESIAWADATTTLLRAR